MQMHSIQEWRHKTVAALQGSAVEEKTIDENMNNMKAVLKKMIENKELMKKKVDKNKEVARKTTASKSKSKSKKKNTGKCRSKRE